MNIVERFQQTLLVSSFPTGRDQAEPKQAKRFRVMPAYEALLGTGIILLAGFCFSGQQWGLLNLQPHPLWIIVLAIAVRYGGSYGYLAGGLSGLAYGLLLWMRPEARAQAIALPELIQPFLMFATGAALGELVRAREQRTADLETQCQAEESALRTLWRKYQTLDEVKAELSRQIAFQSSPVTVLSAVVKKLHSLSVADLHPAILELMSTMLGADACSIYLYQDGHLSLAEELPEVKAHRPGTLSIDHPLLSRVIRERRVMTIRDQLVQAEGRPVNGQIALMAGPLTLPAGRLYGVVLIESLPFKKLTPLAVTCFETLLGWASLALENALSYEQAQLSASKQVGGIWDLALENEGASLLP